jgi:hypothetical protein
MSYIFVVSGGGATNVESGALGTVVYLLSLSKYNEQSGVNFYFKLCSSVCSFFVCAFIFQSVNLLWGGLDTCF